MHRYRGRKGQQYRLYQITQFKQPHHPAGVCKIVGNV